MSHLPRCELGVMGLAVMGRNLALNAAEKGIPTAVWNRDEGEIADALAAEAVDWPLVPTGPLETFIGALARPRRIYMLVKAGGPVDEMLDRVLPALDPGDIVMDGGNSHFRDTLRRAERARRFQVRFLGVGTSGGEEGARHGPALMFGGDSDAHEFVAPILEKIAARGPHGPCFGRVGGDGAGHFVKMVHNGIEYGDMQLIAESMDLLRRGLGYPDPELGRVFRDFSSGRQGGFLVDLSAQILQVKDQKTGGLQLDRVVDEAGQKGTGRWTSEIALELGMPVSILHAALEGRGVSGLRSLRAGYSSPRPPGMARFSADPGFERDLDQALYLGRAAGLAQGLSLCTVASREWKLGIDLPETLRVWTAGCILRSRLLDELLPSAPEMASSDHPLLAKAFRILVTRHLDSLRRVVGRAVAWAVPVPALSAALALLDMLRSAKLPQSLIQAQRDSFGAHGLHLIDQPGAPLAHLGWNP